MAPRDFVSEEEKSLVLVNGTTKSGASLRACVGWLNRNGLETRLGVRYDFHGEGILCLDSAIPQIAEDIAVDIVASRLGNDIYDPTHGTPVFRHVIAGDDLKLLNSLLGNSCAHAIH